MSDSPHLTVAQLRAFTRGQADSGAIARVTAHLDGCAECCARLDELFAQDALVTRLQTPGRSERKILVAADQRRQAARALQQLSSQDVGGTLSGLWHADATTPPVASGDTPLCRSRPDPDTSPDTHRGLVPRANRTLVPGYEILAELGRGGMGVVFKARHLALDRLVALKMLRDGVLADADTLTRFHDEARAVARMQHPGLVQIHEIGTLEGQPYLALEYVPGPSLEQFLQAAPQPPRDAAALLIPLAQAMHAAHAQGIIHRDLKPANVLLARKSEIRCAKSETISKDLSPKFETQHTAASEFPASDFGFVSDFALRISDVLPKVTDFGLAKPLDAATARTVSGVVVGTPSYMAPEQAGGQQTLGPAVDIYALGAILYEMLTGRPPFKGVTVYDTMHQVLHDEPLAPRRLQPRIPSDLETICLKCLHKEPGKRYLTAQELADDVGRFLDGRPIEARPVNRLERGWRWCRRNPVVAGMTAAMMLLVMVGSAAGWLLAAWAFQSEETATKEGERAKAERDTAQRERQRAEQNLTQARRAVDNTLFICRDHELFQGEALRRHRHLLLDKALPFYRDFVRQTGDDPAARAEHAELLRCLACTYSEVGNPAAVPTCREALAILERLVKEHPQELPYQEGLVHTWNSLGRIHGEAGEKKEALDCFQRARDIASRLAAGPAPTLEHENILSKAWSQVARAQRDLGQVQAAMTSYAQSLRGLEKLAAAHPRDMGYQTAMMHLWNELAGLHDRQRQPREAAQCYTAARRSVERLQQAQPQFLEYAVFLGGICCNLGTMEVRQGRPLAALPAYAQAVRSLQEVLRREPGNAQARGFLRATFQGRSRALGQLRRASAAWIDAGRSAALDGGARNQRREELIVRTKPLAQGELAWLATLSGAVAARGGTPALLTGELLPWVLWTAPEPER